MPFADAVNIRGTELTIAVDITWEVVSAHKNEVHQEPGEPERLTEETFDAAVAEQCNIWTSTGGIREN